MNIIQSGESIKINETTNMPSLTNCSRCGYVSSQEVCKACLLLEGLNKGLPRLGIGKSSKVKRILEQNKQKNAMCSNTETGQTCTTLDKSIIEQNEDKKCICNGSQSITSLDIEKIIADKLNI
ncbi:hypothetical protein NQ318_009451 [Aromia moschata]|uniref:Cytoplasmic tRNA 2-thiolation protein 1 C-terminal domain-containing protein n=1 Tax=Aromia moschata TaxID=1265417 RepID=A0AAV8Z901_9CUCU|nr:hypothetical protein NQ318_009451 [Aromia moschata]